MQNDQADSRKAARARASHVAATTLDSAPAAVRKPLVEMRGLSIEFETDGRRVCVVEDLWLEIFEGETVCLVGESGSGKTVSALSIARLLPSPPARFPTGQVLVQGRDVMKLSHRELRGIRGGVVSYIFQEPGASLNPVFRVGSQIREALRLHRREVATDEEVIRLLRLVGIPAPEQRRLDYPHQLSGGMQQRVMIAMALASHPRLLVADEPTTALDVTIQAQILDLLGELKTRLGMSMLLITHNLPMVSGVADRVAVMYAGQLVECAPASRLLRRPRHPYTRALLASVPRLGITSPRLPTIPGHVPQPGAFPSGCRFHPRCAVARPECARHSPELVEIKPGHRVRCPFWENDSPASRPPGPASRSAES